MLSVPNLKELVLLGGGHSHVEVLRSWGMHPVPGVRLTLITRDMHTPYSGMLPGYVSGFYTYDDCHIDLCRLATFARARLIHAEADGIDIESRRVLFPARPPVPYDLLSIDIGITPAATAVPGAAAHTVPVKPIDKFVRQFDALLQRVKELATPLNIAVVGGGAGGVELALALAYRLKQEHSKCSTSNDASVVQQDTISLFCRGSILADHPLPAAAAVRQAAAAPWLRGTGLPTDSSGFLLINEFLQSAGGPPEVFATGDVATSSIHPRPKAGVFAVRQGPPLADNLRRALTGQPLQPFVPQSLALALISTGNRYAVGSRGWLTFQGAWAWKLKDYIDRSFMDKYGAALPFDKMSKGPPNNSMSGTGSPNSRSGGWWSWVVGRSCQQQLPGAYQIAGGEGLELLAAAAGMRCGGCGAKVGSSTLRRALARVKQVKQQQEQLRGAVQIQQDRQQQLTGAVSHDVDARLACLGLGADDAAVLQPPPPGHLVVSTIDFFRSFWPDAYLLGAIAANHALGDCYAMGATPASALALAVLPFGPSVSQENELADLLTGAVEVLGAAGCELVGGHSSEGAELAAVLAAAMKGKAKGRWVSSCLEGMQMSSADAARVLQQHGCAVSTDVTGFGLLGHVVEMARASQVRVALQLAALPALPGALECLSAGITAGGLLAGVPEDQAAACIADLQQMGYEAACVIGRVTEHVKDMSGQGQDCDLHGRELDDNLLTAPMVHVLL
eukprot:gene5837-6078_t